MKLLKLLCFLLVASLIFSCAGKNILKDPAKEEGAAYKVNTEKLKLPTFFRLPPENKTIALKFQKSGMKPAIINLSSTANGWVSDNGKTLPLDKSGLAIDFLSGKIYEIPRGDIDNILKDFTEEDLTVIGATYTDNDTTKFLQLAVVDAQSLYGRDELKYLNVLNGLPEVKPVATINTDSAQSSLIEKTRQADVNAVLANKPIISAAANGQYDRLIKLLSDGGNVNEIDEASGDNALIKAARNGDTEIANILIDKKINEQVVNKNGQTALHVASEAGLYDISKKLLDAGINPNLKDIEGNTPLMYAAVSPNQYLTDLLVDRGGNINDKNKKGETPLSLASYVGNTKTVDSLVNKGADVKTADNDGNGLAMKAIAGNNERTLDNLLSFGTPSDMPNKNGVFPIHKAVQTGNPNMVSKLLQNGANVNVQDQRGNTPLMLAASDGNLEMAENILEYAPDTTLKNKDDQTAYDIASEKGNKMLQRSLASAMERGDNLTTKLFERVAANDVDGARATVAQGARINASDITTGNTPIFTAVANNYKFMVPSLLDLGADINHKNKKGNTPLIVAITSADLPMVSTLIQGGASINAQNNNGDTALIWAVKLKNNDIIKELLLAGADPNIKNNDGISAYIIAYNEGPIELRNILQAAGGRL